MTIYQSAELFAFSTFERNSNLLINEVKTYYYYFNTLLQHLHPGVLLTEIWVNIGKMIANYQEIITLVSYHIMLCCVWSWQVAVYWHMIQWFLVTHLVSLRPIPQCFTASVRTKDDVISCCFTGLLMHKLFSTWCSLPLLLRIILEIFHNYANHRTMSYLKCEPGRKEERERESIFSSLGFTCILKSNFRDVFLLFMVTWLQFRFAPYPMYYLLINI